MELTAPLLKIIIACLLCVTACVPAEHDKDRSDPEPAVGRTYDQNGTEQTDSTDAEASHPIRNIESEPTKK